MTVALPPVPRGATVNPRLVRVSGDLVSPLGGPTQRITRLGSRYAADVELPTLDADCAARWIGAALQAEAEGATLSLVMPQMVDLKPMLGAALTGTGAAGSNAVTYVGPDPKPGMWFSFVAGGRHYLHLVTAVNVAGHSLKVSPLLRVAMPAATALEYLAPVLEGFAEETTWSLEFFKFVGHRITITENA